jgi:Ser-tRNA(Ala) deacylase AlaX
MTILLYLQDLYLKEMEAKVVEVNKENDGRWIVILDKRFFIHEEAGNQQIKECFLQKAGQAELNKYYNKGKKYSLC